MTLRDDMESLRNKTREDIAGEVIRLRNAIRRHRDQFGDDACWMDNHELYRHLPEGYTPPELDTEVELENCRKYIESRRCPFTTYVSPQRRIEELENKVRELEDWIEHVKDHYR